MRLRNPWIMTKEENMGLPVPRLEIRKHDMSGDDMYNVRADYGMVYEHLMGHLVFVPFGCTKIGASARYDYMDLPFRDGSHLLNEMFFLKLRGFVVYKDQFQEVFLTKENMPNGLSGKLKVL